MSDLVPVSKSGWLLKRSDWIKQWRNRFFKLQGNTLSFAKTEDSKPHGIMKCFAVEVVSEHENHKLVRQIKISCREKKHVRIYFLRASSPEEETLWVDAIRNGFKKVKGIKFNFLRDFVLTPRSSYDTSTKTTGELCHEVIVPLCESYHCSIMDNISISKTQMIGDAEYFISHAWNYNVFELIDAIGIALQRLHGANFGDAVIWIDILCVHQHPPGLASVSSADLTNQFIQKMLCIDNVISVVMPWQSSIYFSRLWCVFEIYYAKSIKCHIDIAMSSAETRSFLKALHDAPDSVLAQLTTIRTECCVASVPDDERNIKSIISEEFPNGFEGLDREVTSMLHDWMSESLVPHVGGGAYKSELKDSGLLIENLIANLNRITFTVSSVKTGSDAAETDS